MRVLADTSVWVQHLRSADAPFALLLATGRVVGHPFVTGEVLMGSLRDRVHVRAQLNGLPQLEVAAQAEVQAFVEQYVLFSRGIGYVDVNLLFSCHKAGCNLLTFDKALARTAGQLGLGFAAL